LNRSIVLLPQAVSGTGFQSGGWIPAQAYASIVATCPGGGSGGDTATLGGALITTVSGTPGAGQIQFSSTAATLCSNLYSYINANTSALGVNATSLSGASFTFTDNTVGSAGNSYALSTTGSSFLFGGQTPATLGGGANSGGGTNYQNAITQANAIIAAYPNTRLIAILANIGTNDAAMSSTLWQTNLQNMIAGLRSSITGGTNVPFVDIGMVPEYIPTAPRLIPIENVLAQMPAINAFTAFVPGAFGSDSQADGCGAACVAFHFDAPTQRTNGLNAYQAFYSALANITNTGFAHVITQLQTVGGAASTSTTTGDIVVGGGEGVGGNLHVGGGYFGTTGNFTSAIQSAYYEDVTGTEGYFVLSYGLTVVTRGSTTAPSMVVQEVASQTSPVANWVTSTGSVLDSFDYQGNITSTPLAGTGSRPVCVTAAGKLEAGSLSSGLVTCP
jgi:hypothetical protein